MYIYIYIFNLDSVFVLKIKDNKQLYPNNFLSNFHLFFIFTSFLNFQPLEIKLIFFANFQVNFQNLFFIITIIFFYFSNFIFWVLLFSIINLSIFLIFHFQFSILIITVLQFSFIITFCLFNCLLIILFFFVAKVLYVFIT